MMRRGLITPAAERWQEVKQIAAQAREIAAEFKDWARDWLERLVDGMQERAVADGPSMRQREPQSALEQLQAARDGRDRDTGAEVVRNKSGRVTIYKRWMQSVNVRWSRNANGCWNRSEWPSATGQSMGCDYADAENGGCVPTLPDAAKRTNVCW